MSIFERFSRLRTEHPVNNTIRLIISHAYIVFVEYNIRSDVRVLKSFYDCFFSFNFFISIVLNYKCNIYPRNLIERIHQDDLKIITKLITRNEDHYHTKLFIIAAFALSSYSRIIHVYCCGLMDCSYDRMRTFSVFLFPFDLNVLVLNFFYQIKIFVRFRF